MCLCTSILACRRSVTLRLNGLAGINYSIIIEVSGKKYDLFFADSIDKSFEIVEYSFTPVVRLHGLLSEN